MNSNMTRVLDFSITEARIQERNKEMVELNANDEAKILDYSITLRRISMRLEPYCDNNSAKNGRPLIIHKTNEAGNRRLQDKLQTLRLGYRPQNNLAFAVRRRRFSVSNDSNQ